VLGHEGGGGAHRTHSRRRWQWESHREGATAVTTTCQWGTAAEGRTRSQGAQRMGRRGPWCSGGACLCVGRAGEWLEKASADDAVIGGKKTASGRLRGPGGFSGWRRWTWGGRAPCAAA
jgi:hypothetical protein